MKKLIGCGAALLLMFALFLGFRTFCVQKVPLGYVGVKSNLLTGGIVQTDLEPGYHVVLPGMHKLQLMDARKQTLFMSPRGSEDSTGFQLIAKDQFTVGLDISIIYRLEEGMGHKAIQKYGEGDGFRDKMRNRAEKILTEVLPQLTTEEFFDTKLRTEQAEKAKEELNRSMRSEDAREYLTVHHLLIRNVDFDPQFEQRLLEKQIFDQEKELFEAKAKTEKELEKTETIAKQTAARVLEIGEDKAQAIAVLQAQTDAKIAKIDADAKYYADTVVAEAERYKREQIAVGDLERTKAQALGDELINTAYSGVGGQLLLVQKMIENVSFGDIEINTNRTNPFDVGEMLDMLGVSAQTLQQAAQGEADYGAEFDRLLEAAKKQLAQPDKTALEKFEEPGAGD